MLGVSFSELAITCLIAFLVMRPQDIRKVAYWYKYVLRQIMELKTIAQDSIDDINEEFKKPELKISSTQPEYAIDNNKKLQKTYNNNPLRKNDS